MVETMKSWGVRETAHRALWLALLVGGVFMGPVLFAQASTAVGVKVATAPSSELAGSMVWAFFVSSAMEWMKRHPQITFLSQQTTFWAQRIMGFVIAFASAMGVHYTFDSTAGTLVITGLVFQHMWTVLVESVRQWVVQEYIYRTAVKPFKS